MLCSCGRVLLWDRPEDWEGHLLDALAEGETDERVNDAAEDAPGRADVQEPVDATFEDGSGALRGQIKSVDRVLKAVAKAEPDSPQRLEYDAQRYRDRVAAGFGDVIDRARATGPERRKLPSRSREARKLEQRRRRARLRGEEPDMTPTEYERATKALRPAQRSLRR
jgi:hypothetical protein